MAWEEIVQEEAWSNETTVSEGKDSAGAGQSQTEQRIYEHVE